MGSRHRQILLKPGVFHLQQIQPISLARMEKKLGRLTDAELATIKSRLVDLLNLLPPK